MEKLQFCQRASEKETRKIAQKSTSSNFVVEQARTKRMIASKRGKNQGPEMEYAALGSESPSKTCVTKANGGVFSATNLARGHPVYGKTSDGARRNLSTKV